jgi:predicted membrane-bound mannosyltransferase
MTEAANANANVVSAQNKISELEGIIASTKAELETVLAEKEEAAKKIKEDEDSKDEENKNLKAALEAANEVIAGYKMQEEEMKKKEKKMARKAALLDKGIDSEVAEATVEKFDELTDDAFEAMTSLWAAKMPPWMNKEENKDKKKKDKMKASDDTDPVDETVLETVEETEEVDLGVGDNEENNSSAEITRAALIEFVYDRLGKKLNKGE